MDNADFYPIPSRDDLFYWFTHAISPMIDPKDILELKRDSKHLTNSYKTTVDLL